jgi:hypothetical protein
MGNFTYIGKETRTIIKAFMNTEVNISLSTNNTLSYVLTIKSHTTRNKCDNREIYQLTCPMCHKKKYLGQIGNWFKTRIQENFRNFKYRNNKSTFPQHLLQNGNSTASIEDIMETIYFTKKGKMMNTLEKFYIFSETRLNNQTNDKSTVKPNVIFDSILGNDQLDALFLNVFMHLHVSSSNCSSSGGPNCINT